MTSTLQRYIFIRLFFNTLYFVLGIGSIALLIDFTEFSNRTSQLPDYTAGAALLVSAMRVPMIIQIAMPFIMLFATVATLIGLNRKYELVVARASGVSAWAFLRPTWLCAFFIGALIVLVINPLAAEGFSRATQIEGQWRGTSTQNSLLSQKAPWLRQSDIESDDVWVINAQRSSNNNGLTRLVGATFMRISSDGAMLARHDARVADLRDREWILRRVTTTKAGVAPETSRTLSVPTNLDPNIIAEALLPPEMVSIYTLPKQISTAESFGVAAFPFRMQFHALVALPLLLVAMTMIASTVSLRFVRFGQSASMIVGGIACGFVLYVLVEFTKSFGSAGIIHPVLAAWIPVFVAAMSSVTYLLFREDG
ncbi:MAG: LPS export ABC transporter permease LptG [Pseudomonadota bacterium]